MRGTSERTFYQPKVPAPGAESGPILQDLVVFPSPITEAEVVRTKRFPHRSHTVKSSFRSNE